MESPGGIADFLLLPGTVAQQTDGGIAWLFCFRFVDCCNLCVEIVDSGGSLLNFFFGRLNFCLNVLVQALPLQQHFDDREGDRKVQAPEKGDQSCEEEGEVNFSAVRPNVWEDSGKCVHSALLLLSNLW